MLDLATPVQQLSFVVLDVETTGLEPEDRIVEVAALRLAPAAPGSWTEIERFESLINPQVHIPPQATAVSGIDDALVSGAPSFAAVWPSVARLLADAVFVAHNAPFDLHFMSSERKRAGLGTWDGPVLDTLRLARNVVHAPRYALAELVATLGLAVAPAHRALADVQATVELLLALLARIAPAPRTLADLLQAQEPQPVAWDAAEAAGLITGPLALLVPAAQDGEEVILDYESRTGLRRMRVRPLRIESNGPLHYLQVEPGETQAAPLRLRLDRIRRVSPLARDATTHESDTSSV